MAANSLATYYSLAILTIRTKYQLYMIHTFLKYITAIPATVISSKLEAPTKFQIRHFLIWSKRTIFEWTTGKTSRTISIKCEEQGVSNKSGKLSVCLLFTFPFSPPFYIFPYIFSRQLNIIFNY